MESFDISVCNVRVRISSDDANFMRYARMHFEPILEGSDGTPEVRVSFSRERSILLSELEGSSIVCRGVYSLEDHFVWNEVPFIDGLTMKFSRLDGALNLEAFYSPRRTVTRTLKGLARNLLSGSSERRSFYFEIMYELVYYPLFWALRTRNIYPMHAGAAVYKGLGIVVPGAQGTGKSTLIAGLLADEKSGFVSDNILLYDAERVYPCHEPLRLSSKMLAHMNYLNAVLVPVNVPVPLGRKAFNVKRECYRQAAKPDVFVFPRLSSRRSEVIPIELKDALRRLMAFNTLADEIRSYEVFSSILELASFGSAMREERSNSLESLLSGARCFEFAIRRGEHPADSICALDNALFGSSGARET